METQAAAVAAGVLGGHGLAYDLGHAIDHDELVVYYQPEIDLRTGAIIGVEALLRWNHPAHGLISPDYFIPLAEASGLIGALGSWTLAQACNMVQRLRRDLPGLEQLRLNVNVSPRQLTRDFVGKVARISADTGIPHSQLVLELTENTLVNDIPTAAPVLIELDRLGVQLAIDDFGVGYSRLSYLLDLPIAVIKLDKSFINRLHDPTGSAIVGSVIQLAGTLGLSVTAEGVETPGQQHHLKRLGCTRAQGFLFASALPEAQLRHLLQQQSHASHPPVATVQTLRGVPSMLGHRRPARLVPPVTTP